ncbi:MAG: hypothetical protein RSB99_01525 [Bacilli bacterium]
MKKERISLILELLFIFFISLIYGLFVYEVTMDEIWLYGFTNNIASGMIPYLDFNLVTTPLYPLLGSFFLRILGSNLISYYIYNSLLMTFIYYIIRKINKPSAVITTAFIIIVVMIPTYNILCFLCLFLIIYLEQKVNKPDYLIGFILGLLLLTKQSIGLICLLPSLYLIIKKQADGKKRLIGFSIPVICLFIYLLINKAFFPFIDYTILGLFDFRKDNLELGIGFFLTILIILFLLYRLFIKKDKSIFLLYVLAFQIMNYPLFDIPHVLLSLVPVICYLTASISFKRPLIVYILVPIILVMNFIRFTDYYQKNNYIWNNSLNLVKYKYLKEETVSNIKTITSYLIDNPSTYIFSYQAYLFKLEAGLKLDKYDLVNDGNMGYNGASKYIEELSNLTSSKTINFLIPKDDKLIGQTSTELINWVHESFDYIGSISSYNIYRSKDMQK